MEEQVIFIPSHLVKGLFGGAVAIVAGGVMLVSGKYALYQLGQVTWEEVDAFVRGDKTEQILGLPKKGV